MTIYARVAALLCLIVVILGSFYGRALERNFSNLTKLIPHFGIGLLLVLAVVLVKAAILAKKQRRTITRDASFYKLVTTTIVMVLAFVACSESLIVLPIERIHFLKFACLAFCLSYSFTSPATAKSILMAFLIASLIGSVEEGLQNFHPERFFDWRDILLNVVGASFGAGLAGLGLAWSRQFGVVRR